MDAVEAQKVLHGTGSFTGYRPLQALGSDYLSASAVDRQPLCGNKEGWGPLSPFRYDFTPCFIDVWIAGVAVFGLVLGAGAVWFLRKKKQTMGTDKNFHFWLKQV
jgi:ATP-binding cassette subfamily C (CFTR/MRP) protein 1